MSFYRLCCQDVLPCVSKTRAAW